MSYATILNNDCKNNTRSPWQDQVKNQRGQSTQLAISIIFGLSAFLTFCALRPRWTALYHARRKQSKSAQILPELPKSFFGWIPVVYRISKEEVLAAAGLDAFAFLAFFRYAIKFLSVVLFFAVVVILPVNSSYGEDKDKPYWWWPPTKNDTSNLTMVMSRSTSMSMWTAKDDDDKPDKHHIKIEKSYLWMYVVFAYFFTAVALYFLVTETKYLIKMRQAYLAIQSTVTDRTIRLSGIPPRLRSEDKLKGFVEELGIGKVDSVILCRNWAKLDEVMEKRTNSLRKLEEALTKYYGTSRGLRRQYRQPVNNPHHEDHHDEESTSLLISSQQAHAHQAEPDRPRPQHTIRYGPLKLRSKTIDAIDYWEEKLRRYDDKISRLRQEDYEPTPLAFVTMESIAACQMAIQASLDPVPGQLLARAAPSPADVIWPNTYLSRNTRMVRAWSIMLVTGFLSIFWVFLLIPPAGLLSDTVVDKFFPGLKNCDSAEQVHPIANALVRTTLPTLYITLMSVSVPYLYDWMSHMQGMTSQSDIELSIVSKNFFFVFFNLFVVFTLFSSAGEFYDFYNELKEILKDTSVIALAIANAIPSLADFYVNLIILQGLGLMAFRLLEFGSVALYPFYLLSARTPRDHADLRKAPEFRYGFFLPQSMLIFVICTVYSLLPKAWLVILFGLIYFLIASFIYKYQLLYAMEHRQHSTGRLWPMICNRIILGLILFHVAVAGILSALQAYTQAVLIVPLIFATVWFTIYFQRTYFPLMYFIALRSIVRDEPISIPDPSESALDRATDQGRAVDTNSSTGLTYVNPNLTQRLETLWVRKRVPETHPDQPV